MFELVAISEKTADGWRHTLEDGQTIRLGRAPAEGLRTPWDMRISREQADITLRGNRIEVEIVSTAKNSAVFNGMKLRRLNVGLGEVFTMGRTQFCLEAAAGAAKQSPGSEFPPGSSAAIHDEIARLKERREQEQAFRTTAERDKPATADNELQDLRAQVEAARLRRTGAGSPSLRDEEARDVRPPVQPRQADEDSDSSVRKPGPADDQNKATSIRDNVAKSVAAAGEAAALDADFDKKKTALPENASELKRQLEELERRRNADSATDSEKLTDSQYDYVHQLLLQLHRVEQHAVETDSVDDAQDEIKGLQSRIAEAADRIAELESADNFPPREVSGSQQIGYGSNDIRRRARQHRKRIEREGGRLSGSDQLTGSEADILEKLEKPSGAGKNPPEQEDGIKATAPDIAFAQEMADAAQKPDQPSPLMRSDVRPGFERDHKAGSGGEEEPAGGNSLDDMPARLLSLLPEDAQDLVLAIANGAVVSPADQATLAAAFTKALHQQAGDGSRQLAPVEQLAAAFPGVVNQHPVSTETLSGSRSYVRRGEWFGVNEVLRGGVYPATLRGYSPPVTQSPLTPSPTFLVKVPAKAIAGLKPREPLPPAPRQPWFQPLPESLRDPTLREENWSGAQNLLLIDLDRCTKCGDCVEVCGDVHADHLSRLTLQGPTTGQQWAVQNCRACVDPACLAGCPVNAIEQLQAGRVEIHDWCIGCGLCEQQCPYDAIHIYDNAIVSNGSSNWLVAPLGAAPGSRWRQLDFDDSRWLPVTGPFFWSQPLRTSLSMQWPEPPAGGRTPQLCFRVPFAITAVEREQRLTLTVRTSEDVLVWLNGVKLEMTGREIPGEGFPLLWELNIDRRLLQTGDNILSLLAPFGEEDQPLLWARLSASPRHSSNLPSEAALLTPPSQSAVVCDLCHHRDGGPACISGCPETALFRYDGTVE